jgi:hypothetical protein
VVGDRLTARCTDTGNRPLSRPGLPQPRLHDLANGGLRGDIYIPEELPEPSSVARGQGRAAPGNETMHHLRLG